MRPIKMRCQLLTDVILNQKAASEGPNQTLDFIPGSNFLGIVAQHYQELKADAMLLFHSGHVRFGDAHPSSGHVRGLKVPASMFYPKLESPSDKCYIHHWISPAEKQRLRDTQLKQCRSGYYSFDQTVAKKIDTNVNFAIKSARDYETQSSANKQLFGYQSLQKGLVLYFSVDVDDICESLYGTIQDYLTDIHRIGRSRSAQYGLVDIQPYEFDEVTSGASKKNLISVYADSRLIFLDEATGEATYRPTVSQLLKDPNVDGKIRWDLSQIRTFRYSPWNYVRGCFDTERTGIESGSVFVIEAKTDWSHASQYIGSYNNEGFGQVIYNPDFLNADENGIAKYHLAPKTNVSEDKQPPTLYKYLSNNSQFKSSELLQYVQDRIQEENDSQEIYSMVNDWIEQHRNQFISTESFSSQWSTIRSKAMDCYTHQELMDKIVNNKDSYLNHGVAKDKWNKRKRRDDLEKFIVDLGPKGDVFARRALINLASEMAKICRKEKQS